MLILSKYVNKSWILYFEYEYFQNVDSRDQCGDHGDYDERTRQCTCDKFRFNKKLTNYHVDLFHFRFGENCNFFDECLTDEDCNTNGKCIQEESTTIPRYIKRYYLQYCLSPTSFIEYQRNATARQVFMEKTVICYPKSKKKYHLYHPTSHLL